MYDVMQGVRVIEVAEHTFAPSAAMSSRSSAAPAATPGAT